MHGTHSVTLPPLCHLHLWLLVQHKNSDHLEEAVFPSQRPPSLVSPVGTELYQFPVNNTETASSAKHLKLTVNYIINDFISVCVCVCVLSCLVREQTIPAQRAPLVGEVSANFCGKRVLRGQCNGSPWPYSRIPRLELLLFLPSSSSIVLTRLSGPRSQTTTFQKIW
jgi:hypothetical protein